YYYLDALAMIAGSLWSVNLAERAGGAPGALPYAMVGLTSGIVKLERVALHYFTLARAAGAENNDSTGLVLTDYAEATWYSTVGRWAEARPLLEGSLKGAARAGDSNEEEIIRMILANNHFFTGRFYESINMLHDM